MQNRNEDINQLVNDKKIPISIAKASNINNNKSVKKDKNNKFRDTSYSDIEYNAIEFEIEQVKFNVFWSIIFFYFKYLK